MEPAEQIAALTAENADLLDQGERLRAKLDQLEREHEAEIATIEEDHDAANGRAIEAEEGAEEIRNRARVLIAYLRELLGMTTIRSPEEIQRLDRAAEDLEAVL